MALGDIDVHFVWWAWDLVTSTFTLCGRRGAWQHRLSLCVNNHFGGLPVLVRHTLVHNALWQHSCGCGIPCSVLGALFQPIGSIGAWLYEVMR